MRLDEARGLKRALLGGSVALRVDDAEPFSVAEGGVFVGIVPSAEPAGYQLAVRISQPVDDPDRYAAAVRSLAGEQVDIRFVGPIRALAERPEAPQAQSVEAGSVIDVGSDTMTVPTPADLQARVRPLVRGASVAHRDVTAGTIGAFVTVTGSDAVHVLSNNHVLGDSDRGRPGDDVLQPGPADGGSTGDRIGELVMAVALDPDAPNLMDAALAALDPEVQVDLAAHDGPLGGVVEPADVTGPVVKVGRTTGLTVGRITAVEVDGVPVGYDTGTFTFDDQIEIEGVDGGFSAGGDSGSVIYTQDARLGVGLLFAGSTTGGVSGDGVTYANALPTVLTTLGATLVR